MRTEAGGQMGTGSSFDRRWVGMFGECQGGRRELYVDPEAGKGSVERLGRWQAQGAEQPCCSSGEQQRAASSDKRRPRANCYGRCPSSARLQCLLLKSKVAATTANLGAQPENGLLLLIPSFAPRARTRVMWRVSLSPLCAEAKTPCVPRCGNFRGRGASMEIAEDPEHGQL